MNENDARSFLKEHNVKTVMAGGIDQIGGLRGKRMPVSYFVDSVIENGLRFAWFLLNTGSVDTPVDGILDDGVPDVIGRPDLDTLQMVPWEDDTAIVFMDWFWADGRPCDLCPRTLLKQKIDALDAIGLQSICALELEFILLRTPMDEIRRGAWNEIEMFAQDKHCYSLYEGSFYEPVVGELRDYFPDVIEGCTPEWGEGQFEANLRKSEALAMADTAVLFKLATKQVAARHGISATFMAKLKEGYSGNSGHIHHSLRHKGTGQSACFDAAGENRMTGQFAHYVGGMFELLRESTLFFAPYVNSYKRFELDSFAGVTKTWGLDNRTVALRYLNSDAASARIENRVGGADLNPYTAFAAMMGAGLWGIENDSSLPLPMEGNCYHVPGVESVPLSFVEAVDLLQACEPLHKIMGERFVGNLISIARQELTVFNTTVTDLERRRYLEMA